MKDQRYDQLMLLKDQRIKIQNEGSKKRKQKESKTGIPASAKKGVRR